MATSPEEGLASLIRNLEEKTGRSINSWVETARSSGLTKHGALVAFLKKEHGLTHGYANQVAHRALAAAETTAAGSEDLVAAQYAGAKAGLLPIYEALVAAVRKLGSDVEVAEKGECEFAPVETIRSDPAVDGKTCRSWVDPQGSRTNRSVGGVGELQCDVHASGAHR